MNGAEQQRVVVLNRVLVGDLTAAEAAIALERSVRQVRRRLAAYRKEGVAALAHGNRGRTPAHALDPAPGSGRIVRQSGPDALEKVATGLMMPIAFAVGADGGLYVAMPAAGVDKGDGVIARVDVAAAPVAEDSGALDDAVKAAACAQAPAV